MRNHPLKIIGLLFIVGLILLSMSACMTESRSGQVYSREQARVTHTVQYGTVMRVADVMIEGTNTGLGTIAGGVLGGALGNTVGGGRGRTLSTVGGAIVGGLAGSAIENKATESNGVELEVKLDSGEILAIVQEKDEVFNIGDRVRILKDSRGTVRARH